ncbi:MAG: hypothetical protein ACREA4_12645 [Nitrososphaera sp.]
MAVLFMWPGVAGRDSQSPAEYTCPLSDSVSSATLMVDSRTIEVMTVGTSPLNLPV